MRLHRPELELTVGTTHLHAELWQGSRRTWEVDLPMATLAEAGAVLQTLRTTIPGGMPQRLRYRLEPPLVQHRTLADLPAVAPRELGRLVAHNASRYFRQNGHPLVTAGAWEGKPGSVARLIAAEETVLTVLVDAARLVEAEVEDIRATEPAPPTLSLLPASERSRRRSVRRRRLQRIALSAGLVLGLTGAASVGRLVWEDRQLQRELARLEAPRAALVRVRREAAAAEAMLSTLIQADADRGELAGRLAALTERLPADGALEHLQFARDGRGEIEGRVPAVAALLPQLGTLGPVTLPAAAVREVGPAGTLEHYVLRLGPVAP